MGEGLKLVGSKASPYVRRIFLWLHQNNLQNKIAHEYVSVLTEEGQARLQELVPGIRRVPILLDDGKVVFDSYLILKYLMRKFEEPAPTIEDELVFSLLMSFVIQAFTSFK